jgi:hypothetical protein
MFYKNLPTWALESLTALKRSQGFTSHPLTGLYHGDGYSVSPYPERSLTLPMQDSSFAAHILEFTERNGDLLQLPDHYVGGWIDKSDPNKICIDVSVVTHDSGEAELICQKNNQTAYYEFSEQEAQIV